MGTKLKLWFADKHWQTLRYVVPATLLQFWSNFEYKKASVFLCQQDIMRRNENNYQLLMTLAVEGTFCYVIHWQQQSIWNSLNKGIFRKRRCHHLTLVIIVLRLIAIDKLTQSRNVILNDLSLAWTKDTWEKKEKAANTMVKAQYIYHLLF